MSGKWTAEDIPDQAGRTVIVTGANSGIGYETARALAARGATVVIACRNREKGEAAAAGIRARHPGANVELMILDLSDLASVRHFVEEFNGRFDRLDRLINNAGVMMCPFAKTADSFELQFGTNHLGHFALTGLLLEKLMGTSGARIVTVSSTGHRYGKVDFDNLNAEQKYSRMRAYSLSKLANLLFTYELGRRLAAAGSDIIAAASHPGWTGTELQRHAGFFRFLNPIVSQKPPMGALPTLRAATAPDVKTGDYFGPNGWKEGKGHPVKVSSSEASHDEETAKKLWEISEEMTGVRYEFTQP